MVSNAMVRAPTRFSLRSGPEMQSVPASSQLLPNDYFRSARSACNCCMLKPCGAFFIPSR